MGDTVRQQLKRKLASVLLNPRVEANRLDSLPNGYKIKLRSSGYRLIYQVVDQEETSEVLRVAARQFYALAGIGF
ncbi:type II toxin-antitoxin system RelE family toxin [Pseudomonas promysalinigenes]|uniref:Type II toxin-antitoxin system RelE/ParE family toxin n=1 Tax=Pseudomonas promysalinigenes TaxID=485898 RepID=A0ABY6AXM8_9PSED|nr:type II toxin-antitoxin system RelE/ParE family toxin [Pseudomonas promysalinigenes]UXH42235.1 type II toxin-antitoxin system RelE/ParE family toxin [Pseudomonas promysalinigenes]